MLRTGAEVVWWQAASFGWGRDRVLCGTARLDPIIPFEAALASSARRSSRPLRRVVDWAGREREPPACGRRRPAPASTASWVAVPRSRTTRCHHACARAAGRA